jgi:hypothetical protein
MSCIERWQSWRSFRVVTPSHERVTLTTGRGC